ncbi:MAG: VWA domain-containing protein, partial [Candidatus Woesearchaeota archaeon]|nr:VWA domain-containing protein [Candidatus Woesearchaeota archaeon]
VVFFDAELKSWEKIDETSGSLGSQSEEDKLMRSVLQNDKQSVEDGKLLEQGASQGINAFVPSSLFENIVQRYAIAKQLYGERLLRLLTGYSGGYLDRNRKIPEFKKELRRQIDSRVSALKEKGLLDAQGAPTQKGFTLAGLVLCGEELDKLSAHGLIGEYVSKRVALRGDVSGFRKFHQGDAYRNLALRQSVRFAVRRSHASLMPADLRVVTRESKGSVSVVYGLDASASMKGDKLDIAKKAGVALAYRAISQKNKVGLVVFGSEIKNEIAPTTEFIHLVRTIASVSAGQQTNFASLIQNAIRLFPSNADKKLLMILTDALPTSGAAPESETLHAVSLAKSAGIVISLVGIKLDIAKKAG